MLELGKAADREPRWQAPAARMLSRFLTLEVRSSGSYARHDYQHIDILAVFLRWYINCLNKLLNKKHKGGASLGAKQW